MLDFFGARPYALLPGSGFQDCKDQDKSNNIERPCTIEAYWRHCRACKVQVSKRRASRSVTLETARVRRCEGHCVLQRDLIYFEGDSLKCNACKLWETFQLYVCTSCNGLKRNNEMGSLDLNSNTGSCYRCRPDLQLVACTVCNREQPAISFALL